MIDAVILVDASASSPLVLNEGIIPVIVSGASGSGVTDGDKGDIIVSASGATWTVDADAITDAKLRDSAGLSVIGRAANTSGDPADIAAASDGQVLRRSGTALAFGALDLSSANSVTGDLPFANISQLAGLSVAGRGANTTGDMAAITGTANGVLRVSGTTLAFGAVDLATAMVTGRLPAANMVQGAALSVRGVTGNATADVADIAAASDGQVLRRSGTALAFGAVDLSSANAITGDLPLANLVQASAASKLLGRGSASGAGDFQEIILGTNLSMSGTTLNASVSAPPDADYGDITVSGGVWTLDNNVVTDAKLRDSAALSVVGRASNSSGDPADIAAGSDGQVLRRSASTLAFGAVDLSSANAVTGDLSLANLVQASAASKLLGRGSASGAGDFQEITLGTNLSMSGTTLNAAGGLTDGDKGDITVSASGATWSIDNNVVTDAMLIDRFGLSVIGRSISSSGDPADILATSDGMVLRRQGATLGFGTIATAGLADDSITYAKMQNSGAGNVVLARAAATAGDFGEVAVGASQILGRGATGDIAAITLGTNLSMSGTTLNASGGGGLSDGDYGDVVVSAAATVMTVEAAAGAFAVAGLLTANGGVVEANSTSAATPAADKVASAHQQLRAAGGRTLPRWKSEDGTYTTAATHQGRNTIAFGQAFGNSSSALTQVGITSLTPIGTPTARNVAATNRLTRARRLGYVSTVTAGTAAGLQNASANTQWTVGGAAGAGFMAIFRFGVGDASLVAGAHSVIGMRSSTATPTPATNPNTLTNIIALAQTNGSANWQIVYGGSAAQTQIDTGIPITITSEMELIIYARPDVDNKVTIRVEDISTGTVYTTELTGTAGTALPANTTFLGPLMWRSNNATGAVAGIDIISYYIESDT